MTDTVQDKTVVTMEYTLRDDEGNIVDSSEGSEPLTYLHGYNNIVPGLEKALSGKASGDEVNVSVPPDEGYGPIVPEMIQKVPKEVFEGVDTIEPGMQFQAQAEHGIQIIRVVSVEGDEVTVDANHPMAGKTLHFEVRIKELRLATEEEIAKGHAHED